MVSTVSWLDSSVEEQRRLRDIIGLFTDKDTQDDLGIGQIRDALGDGLFPGTSTLHTRAKYLLFIPWVFESVAARGGTVEHTRNQEIDLIFALKQSEKDNQGIIGVNAGRSLRTVPSTQYWSALGAYGILLNRKVSREEAVTLHTLDPGLTAQGDDPNAFRVWRASLPKAPTDFPYTVPDGFELQFDEANWLQERIIDSTRGTVLAHLAEHGLDPDSKAPWEDPGAAQVTGDARALLTHARLFSDTMHGAQLLYNVFVAESHAAEGFTGHEETLDMFKQRFAEWAEMYASWAEQQPWNLDDFFMQLRMIRNGTPVSRRSQQFLRDWVQLLGRVDVRELLNDEIARKLISRQERGNKGAMARIGNPKRLATWGGSSGAGKLTYRWGIVQRVLGDIHDGLNRAEGAQ